MAVTWLNPGDGEQTEEQWSDEGSTTIGLRLEKETSANGWSDILLVFNPHEGNVSFVMPHPKQDWILELTTSDPEVSAKEIGKISTFDLEGRRLVVLRPKGK
jgi:glycogen operon protein